MGDVCQGGGFKGAGESWGSGCGSFGVGVRRSGGAFFFGRGGWGGGEDGGEDGGGMDVWRGLGDGD